MAEALGEALLVLRTDDRGLETGIAGAKAKSQELGRTLDSTSGSAGKLTRTLTETGAAAGQTGAKTGEYSRQVAQLKAAIDPAWGAMQKFKEQAALARQAMQQGAISGKQYVDFMRQSASAAGLLTSAQSRVTEASAGQKAGLVNLTRQLSDVSTMYSMGAKPVMIFSSQIGQLMDALQQASGGTSRFATFMSGPWGMALTAATVVLGPLIAKMFDSSDAANKASTASETMVEKLDRQRHSQEQVTQALRDYNAEQKKAKESTLDAAKAAQWAAQTNLTEVMSKRLALNAKLIDRQNELETDVGAKGNASPAVYAQVEKLRRDMAENQKLIDKARIDLRDAGITVAEEQAKIDADPIQKIKADFDDRRQAAESTIQSVEALRKKLVELNKQEKEAIKQAQQDDRAADKTNQSGREVTLSEAMSIAKGAGFTITSGQRSYASQKSLYDKWVADGRPADNPVAKPGNSAHNRGEGMDIAFGSGVNIAAIRKAFTDQGVALTKVLTERGHYHIEFSTVGADKQASEEAQQAKKSADVQNRADRELGTLMQEAVKLRQQMATTLEDRFKIEQEALDTAMAEQRRRVTDNVEYTPEQKKALLAQIAVRETLERQALALRKKEEIAKQDLEVAQAFSADQIDQLQRALQFTDIRKKRLEIERQILDLTYAQRKRALEATIANPQTSDSQRTNAKSELNNLDRNKAQDSKRLEREYQSPIQRYQQELKTAAGNINDSLQTVAVNGLQTLQDRLVDVIMQTKSLGEAFKDVAKTIISELLKIALQRELISPLADLLFGKSSSNGGTSGGLFSTIGSALGSIFGGAHADGGLIPAGTIGIVGERGPEPVMATSAGAMVRTTTTLGAQGNKRGALNVTVSGARGNSEIEAMVRSGVQQGLAAYDNVVGKRVQNNLSRRG